MAAAGAADADLLPELVALAGRAGGAILAYYGDGGGDRAVVEARAKADASPVTAADEAAEAVILEGLARLTPDWPAVAEEAVAAGRVPDVGDGGPFWLVDPLDGTKEFLGRNGEFTVNVALVQGRRPVLGVVLAPALGCAWWGAAGRGAWRRDAAGGEPRPIRARRRPADGGVAAVSRSHLDPDSLAYLEREGVRARVTAGSSLKFCLIAEGRADVYPRFGRTMEWDTAAGHAVLAAAGGRVVAAADGADLGYGKPGFENPPFVALGA